MKILNVLKILVETLILFIIGGFCYLGIEIGFRGWTHWSMFIVGGICFVSIGVINQCYFTWNMNIFKQMLISTILITVIEFIAGCIINLWLGWHVWDYSHQPLDILGQVCVPFMVLWFFLSFVAILVDDLIRNKIFGEEKPHYYL